MWDFEHPPEQERLVERYSISRSTPSECAAKLAAGTADIGLIPVAAYASIPGLSIIPGCAIASLDYIRSIILVVRGEPEQARTVALDTSSRTSATYTRILFYRYWNRSAQFLEAAPDLDAMLAAADAALLIGDPALLALEDRELRQQRTGEQLTYLDLGHEWRMRTGVPWISAFWAVRDAALESRDRAALISDFNLSREHGQEHIEDLVAEWSERIRVPAETVRAYLSGNIHYELDAACIEGLELFFRYGQKCGTLPVVQKLNFLEAAPGGS